MRSRGGARSRSSTIEKRLKADKIETIGGLVAFAARRAFAESVFSASRDRSARENCAGGATRNRAPFPRFIESTPGRLGERRRFSPGHRTKAFCIPPEVTLPGKMRPRETDMVARQVASSALANDDDDDDDSTPPLVYFLRSPIPFYFASNNPAFFAI